MTQQDWHPPVTETELDNLLVGQKDKIICLIDNEQWMTALRMLMLLRPLWIRCNYAYKMIELVERAEISTNGENRFYYKDGKLRILDQDGLTTMIIP